MASYRLYFKALGSIVGRQDFEAEDDAAAQRIAAVLFDACSDRSQNIELWQGERLLSLNLPGRGAGLDSLCEAHQEIAVNTEEIMFGASGPSRQASGCSISLKTPSVGDPEFKLSHDHRV